jgi:hypothetical protein
MFANCLMLLVQLGGLEPPTSCSTDRRSNQLSYNCILRKRAPKKGVPNGRKLGATLWFGKAGTASKANARTGRSKTKTRAIGPGFVQEKPSRVFRKKNAVAALLRNQVYADCVDLSAAEYAQERLRRPACNISTRWP